MSGIVLTCLLCSCASNKESVDFSNSAMNKEGQNTEVSDNQSQSSNDINNEQTPVSAGISNNQSQDSENVSNEQTPVSAGVSNSQSQDSESVSNAQAPTSGNVKDNQSNSSVNEKNEQSKTFSNEEGEKLSLSPEESYRAVLLDNGNFISTDLQNKKLNLSEIKKVVTDDEDITASVSKFTIADLSSNGENEVILWIQINGVSDFGFEILQYKDGDVYGYTLSYREFMNLKTDGTFIFSSGVANSGIGKLIFSENGYTVDKLYYSEGQYDSNNEFKIQYFANGEVCSEEEFNDAMSRQEEKTNVKWYDLSSKSVDSALESVY